MDKVVPLVKSGPIGLARVMSTLVDRLGLGGQGFTFGGKRNLADSFGYPSTISPADIARRYERGGIAKRIVDAYPDATWGNPPTVTSLTNPEFDVAWKALNNEYDVWSVLRRLDVLGRLGTFAVLLIGTDRGNLASPLRGASKITFLQPFGETSVRILSWDKDQRSPRFQLPEKYRVYPNGVESDSKTVFPSTGNGAPSRPNFDVHYSRMLHIAHGIMEDTVFGRSTLVSTWNYLIDLDKVVGAGAENFWITANRGMQIDVDKDMDFTDEDAAALSDEVDDFQHNLRRTIRTRGVKINNLGSDVSDPRGTYDPIIDLISGSTGIPRRILLGTESGHLASTQDKGNWAERIEEYRTLEATPYILDPFIWALVDAGILPDPGDYEVAWPDAYRMSPLERGQQSAQISRTVSNLVRGTSEWQKLYIERERQRVGQAAPAKPAFNALPPPADKGKKAPFGKVAKPAATDTAVPVAPAAPTPDPIKMAKIPDMLLTYDEMRKIINEATDKRTIMPRGRRKK